MPSEEDAQRLPGIVRRSTLSPSYRLCPRCLNPLTPRGKLGGWLIPQDYFCASCGYAGTVYLEGAPKVPDSGET